MSNVYSQIFHCLNWILTSKRHYLKVANTTDGISAFVKDRNLEILVGGSYKLGLVRSGRSFTPPTRVGTRTDRKSAR